MTGYVGRDDYAGPPFTDVVDGVEHMLSPPHAAAHCIFVQGGFSDAGREAHRMVKDGGIAKERAEAWFAEKGHVCDDTCDSVYS